MKLRRVIAVALVAACASSAKPTLQSTAPERSTTPPVPDRCKPVEPDHPKISPLLGAACFGRLAARDGGRVLARVMLANQADPNRAKASAEALAGSTARVLDDRPIGGSAQLVIKVATAAQVLELSAVEGVVWIEPWPTVNEDDSPR